MSITSLGWRRTDPRPWRKLSARWAHLSGWTLEHCGHQTAHWPWILKDPQGLMHLTGGHYHGDPTLGTCWPTLEMAANYAAVYMRRRKRPLMIKETLPGRITEDRARMLLRLDAAGPDGLHMPQATKEEKRALNWLHLSGYVDCRCAVYSLSEFTREHTIGRIRRWAAQQDAPPVVVPDQVVNTVAEGGK